MEVLDETAALLCDYEVLTVVEQQLAQSKAMQTRRPNPGQQNLHTVLYEVKQHLTGMPCKSQSEDSIEAFLEEMKQYPLFKAERLQLLDSRPTSEVALMLMIEECDKRFSEDEVAAILASVRRTLPPGPGQEDAEAEQDAEGMDDAADEPEAAEEADEEYEYEQDADEDEFVAENNKAVAIEDEADD
eukprot:TRINITY_DN2853_c0_g1_i1.p1 TRINITY_DN2853_c0_g1~~TRINITY_DN2853_c0_g1_i1.p1  ORF type:complete len:187 (+),score=67.94 TRINITY_DN2853_c0_g1_i1:73-633(+)